MTLKLSLAQIDLRVGEPEANFQRIRALTERASLNGSQLLVLPELWSTAYALQQWQTLACPMGEGMFERVAALALEQKIAIAGSILEKDSNRAFNTMTLHGADGKLRGAYRKVHLVPMLDEPRWLAAGDHLVLAQPEWGPTGLGICYDLRFPEMWRNYAVGGAKLAIISAEWPTARIEHWKTLLRARAIENQLFVVACNRVGTTEGVAFGGHSIVLDPFGETIVEAGPSSEALLNAELDFERVDEIRSRIPVLKGRRPEVY